jgi:hypothetical protein
VRTSYVQVCHTCEVQRHEQCIVFAKFSDPNAPVEDLQGHCFCYDAHHQIGIHPELTKRNAYRTTPNKSGGTREVDYELEPFEQFGPEDKGKGGKYGKPATDLEDARAIRDEVDRRNETRRRYAEMDFKF